MGSQVITFLRPNWRHSDWTREELAELYRIEHALVEARLAVDIDRGITDEGDPWFVFCRRDGEVLVHIGRTHNEYFLHSPGLPHPLVGRSFQALTKSFVNQIPVHLPLQSGRGAQLFVHPAAMLAVVIGTIFVASEDVQIFSARDGDANSDSPDFVSPGQRSTWNTSFQAAFQSYIELFVSSLREWGATQQSTYLSVISTVTAFVLSSTTASDLDHAHTASIAELVNGVDASTTDSAGGTSTPNDIAKINGFGQTLAAEQIAFEAAAPHAGEVPITSPAPDGHDNSEAVEPVLNSSITQMGALSAYKSAGAADNLKSPFGLDPDDSASHLKAPQEPVGTNFEPSAAINGNANPVLDSTKTSAATPASQSDVGVYHSAFDTFVDALKVNFSSEAVASNDQAFSGIIPNISSLVPNEHDVINPSLGSTSTGPPASEPVGTTAGSSDQTVDTTHVQLFDAAAAATINAFLKANPNAEIIFDHGNIIIYDGRVDAQPLTVQIWESSATGPSIALIGHADHGPTV